MDDTTKLYVDWIFKSLESQPGKTQSGLADHLGIAHPQISMLKQGKRDLKVREVPIIAEYLEVSPPAWDESIPIRGVAAIEATLKRIHGLTPDDVSFLLKNIKAALADNAGSLQTHPHDQQEHKNETRESLPERK